MMAFDHEFRGSLPAETNEEAPQSTTGHRLVHDSPDCEFWSENASGMSLMHDEELLVLEMVGMRIGDWDGDESPNCPLCGENLYIEEPDGHLIEPKVWFGQVEVTECDGCGETKALSDGEGHQDSIHAAMIDPPDEHWICNACIARGEDADEDRMMEAERPMTDREYYLYEK